MKRFLITLSFMLMALTNSLPIQADPIEEITNEIEKLGLKMSSYGDYYLIKDIHDKSSDDMAGAIAGIRMLLGLDEQKRAKYYRKILQDLVLKEYSEDSIYVEEILTAINEKLGIKFVKDGFEMATTVEDFRLAYLDDVETIFQVEEIRERVHVILRGKRFDSILTHLKSKLKITEGSHTSWFNEFAKKVNRAKLALDVATATIQVSNIMGLYEGMVGQEIVIALKLYRLERLKVILGKIKKLRIDDEALWVAFDELERDIENLAVGAKNSILGLTVNDFETQDVIEKFVEMGGRFYLTKSAAKFFKNIFSTNLMTGVLTAYVESVGGAFINEAIKSNDIIYHALLTRLLLYGFYPCDPVSSQTMRDYLKHLNTLGTQHNPIFDENQIIQEQLQLQLLFMFYRNVYDIMENQGLWDDSWIMRTFLWVGRWIEPAKFDRQAVKESTNRIKNVLFREFFPKLSSVQGVTPISLWIDSSLASLKCYPSSAVPATMQFEIKGNVADHVSKVTWTLQKYEQVDTLGGDELQIQVYKVVNEWNEEILHNDPFIFKFSNEDAGDYTIIAEIELKSGYSTGYTTMNSINKEFSLRKSDVRVEGIEIEPQYTYDAYEPYAKYGLSQLYAQLNYSDGTSEVITKEKVFPFFLKDFFSCNQFQWTFPHTDFISPEAGTDLKSPTVPVQIVAKKSGLAEVGVCFNGQSEEVCNTAQIDVLPQNADFLIGMPIFTDISFKQWHDYYKNHLNFLFEMGVIEGYSDGTFRPDNPVNRAECAKMTVATAELTEIQFEEFEEVSSIKTSQFEDVPKGKWFTVPVNKLANYPSDCISGRDCAINGYSDGTFRPTNEVTRAEMLKMIVQTFFPILPTYMPTECHGKTEQEWYCPYIIQAVDKGIEPIQGKELLELIKDSAISIDTLGTTYATRTETAKAVYDAYLCYQGISDNCSQE